MKTILDIGAFNGESSREFIKPGDKWILVDNQQYLQYDNWKVPKSYPEGATMIFMDGMDYKEPAEIVVCSNVLYHVPDPHAFLKHLRELTLDTLVLRTYFDGGNEKRWNYYGKEHPAHGHPSTAATIFYRPTIPALKEELENLGFDIEINIQGGGLVTMTCKLKKEMNE